MSTASMPMPLASGFVTFDDAPRVRVSLPAPAPAEAVERKEAEPEIVAAGLLQSPVWQPASSGRVRAVEGLVVAALCGWFLYGSLAVFGWV